jgi:hypothetical protein
MRNTIFSALKKKLGPGASVLCLSFYLFRKQRSGGLQFKASQGKQFMRPDLKTTLQKKVLVEWLKV